MFGYITICEPELKVKDLRRYRAHYCGLCRSLKERYGSLGQMTLSYDMTFIVVLLTSLYESALKESIRRCKTHPIKKQQMLQSEITEYAADMNVILTWYHLKDDWQDERKPGSLLGLHVLGRKKAGEPFGAPCTGPESEKGGSEISQTVQGDVSRAEGAGEDGSGKKQGH